LAAVVCVVWAAACGSPDGAATSTSVPASVGSGAPTERDGGRLTVALTGDLPTLDLAQSSDAVVMLVTSHVAETLFTWDADYRAVGLLAESHEVSDDGLTHTLRIREGVPFHNGEVLDADDVVASLTRWGEVSGLGGDVMGTVTEIVATDPRTVTITTETPNGTLPVALARQLQGSPILPASVLAQSTPAALAELVGTGPYRLTDWSPDRRILLERFDEYVGPPGDADGYAGARAQHLDAIEFVPVPSEAARVAGLQAGDYDYLETVSPDHAPVLTSAAGVQVEVADADAWLNVVLNLESDLLADVRIRRAIQIGIDNEFIMQSAFGAGYFELTPELLPGADAWATDAGNELYDVHDPARARELLAEAGYDGRPVRLLASREIPQEYNAAQALAQQLEGLGLAVDLQALDGVGLSAAREDQQAWEMYVAWASFRPDPMMRNLTCAADGWWCDAHKDELLRVVQSDPDFDVRRDAWEQVQTLFYEDVPRLKIGNTNRVLAMSSDLRDVGPTAMQPDFSNAWIE
jgi:peptide/nickel transport system substrate-binding protein